jgi:hypothetical protein
VQTRSSMGNAFVQWLAPRTRRGWGMTLLILGLGSFILPLMERQFVILMWFGAAAPIVGAVLALIGLALVVQSFRSSGRPSDRPPPSRHSKTCSTRPATSTPTANGRRRLQSMSMSRPGFTGSRRASTPAIAPGRFARRSRSQKAALPHDKT